MSIKVITANNDILEATFLGFSGGERHVQLSDTSLMHLEKVTIEARLSDATDIMDMLLLVNALRYRFGQGVVIDVELPYLPYARQDRVCAEGQAFSLEVFVGLLAMMKLNSITVWDCHSQVGIDLAKAKNITPEQIIAYSPELVMELTASDSVLICPDKGAIDRCLAIKKSLSLTSMVQCYKRRDPSTGRITQTSVEVDSLVGKTAVIVDDICDGGFTFIKIAEQLKAKGAERVVLYVTHGIFSKGLGVFGGLIDAIYTTDSIERTFSDEIVNVINYSVSL